LLKVILIEDEDAFLQELTFATPWEDWGCLVVGSAQDGESGLRLVLEQKPDIVLTDIRMPLMDGLQLAERVRTELAEKSPEFIIISGYGDFEYARSALKIGVRNYLLKPLDDDELAATVSRIKEETERRRGRERLDRILDEGRRSALMLFQEYEMDRRQDAQYRYVAAAVQRIHESYQRELSAEEEASRLSISAGYLSRVFKRETGYTFTDYLMYYRVKRAAELLRGGTLRISEVADLVGYGDQRYFSQIFKRIVGLTPSQFKDGI
jgi:two-component system, response regulator YesN